MILAYYGKRFYSYHLYQSVYNILHLDFPLNKSFCIRYLYDMCCILHHSQSIYVSKVHLERGWHCLVIYLPGMTSPPRYTNAHEVSGQVYGQPTAQAVLITTTWHWSQWRIAPTLFVGHQSPPRMTFFSNYNHIRWPDKKTRNARAHARTHARTQIHQRHTHRHYHNQYKRRRTYH